jgi:hypothetical protein
MATVVKNEGGIWNRALVLAAMDGRLDICRLIVEDVGVDVNQPSAGPLLFTPGSSSMHGLLPPLPESKSKSIRLIRRMQLRVHITEGIN